MSGNLRQALEQVASRFRHLRLWSGLTFCWLSLAVIGALTTLLQPSSVVDSSDSTWLLGSLAILTLISGITCISLSLRSVRDPRWVARRIEAKHPELATELLAAYEEVEKVADGRLGFLQATIVQEALGHRETHDWNETVPTWQIRIAKLAHAVALSLLLVVFASLIGQVRSSAFGGFGRSRVDSSEVQVDPGDTEIERGNSLLVIARFHLGAPSEAHLVVEGGPEGQGRRSMTRSLADPTFAGRVESLESDINYRVEFEGRSTDNYHVRVFEFPALKRADARLVFPTYTKLEPKVVEDVRHVTAVEGTELTLLCRLNKDVTSATLLEKGGESIELARDDSSEHTYSAKWTVTEPGRYKLKLQDADGRLNPIDYEIVINVTRNHPPTVTTTQPSHDVQVSPLEELKLKARMEDDFGLVRQGISYSVGGQEPKEIVLTSPQSPSAKPVSKVAVEHMLEFETMRAIPDQLVTYFFWAEDIGPDGQTRRASGDMFFAEVRPFDEIFRQGEQPSSEQEESEQQEGGNAQESGRLAELQRQIINGTWKLIRRETRSKPTDAFAEDSKTLRESQKAVIEQATQMGERLSDATSKANLEEALKEMRSAEKQLAEAAENGSIKALTPALAAEQAASQALLKLRAREFQVTRNSRSRSRSRSSSSSPSQRQLQQLELSAEENRYEEQRTARAQQENQTQRDREQRENRQVLNRLRELAQRQNDLNDRLKELQSALEAAKTQQAREEIDRQLKRLREQQQEILRDSDELRERMENEENQQRMAEARRQMEQSRDHVRQASQALEEGRLPQALTEGARAGRELNDLREKLRKETSNRFSETMTEMRDQARRLDENQKRLNEQLDAWDKNPQHSLRDTDDRKKVRENAEQQSKQLDQILDRMRTTTEEAEDTEPLLAKNLYDTVRKATEQKIPEALKATQQLVDAGIAEEAAKAAHHAGPGIEQLRQGVEHAAKSVLGDGTEALRRAQGEIDQLADQVNREIEQGTGRETAQRPGSGSQPGRPNETQPPGAGQPGEGDRQGEIAAGPNRQEQSPGGPPRASEKSALNTRSLRPSAPGTPAQQPPQPGRAEAPADSDATGQSPGHGHENAQADPPGPQGRQPRPGQRGQQTKGQQSGEPGGPQEEGQEEQQGEGQQGQQRQGQQGQQGPQGQDQQRQGQQGQQGQQGPQGQGQQGRQGPQGPQGQGQQGRQGQQGPQGQGQQGRQGQQGQQGLGQQGQQGSAQQRQGQQGQPQGGGGGGGSPGGATPAGRDNLGLDQVADRLQGGPGGPITGEGFRQWSDRMRDVEELLEQPEWRAEAARIRDRVRGAREEFRRHSKEPDWNKLQNLVAEPIRELRNRIADEVRRRESPDALVPIDRDPVPPQFADSVRRYYERLGSGK